MGGPAWIDGIEYPQFDNFYEAHFRMDGLEWISSEHAYQASKFKDLRYRKEINKQTNPHVIYMMGQTREYELIDNFEEKKYGLMFRSNLEKFKQNPELRKLLQSTNGSIKFHASTEEWNKWNAQILEIIRDIF